jgi:hypothetical protein
MLEHTNPVGIPERYPGDGQKFPLLLAVGTVYESRRDYRRQLHALPRGECQAVVGREYGDRDGDRQSGFLHGYGIHEQQREVVMKARMNGASLEVDKRGKGTYWEQFCPFESKGAKCGLLCPHFQTWYDLHNGKKSIRLSCGGQGVSYDLEVAK